MSSWYKEEQMLIKWLSPVRPQCLDLSAEIQLAENGYGHGASTCTTVMEGYIIFLQYLREVWILEGFSIYFNLVKGWEKAVSINKEVFFLKQANCAAKHFPT